MNNAANANVVHESETQRQHVRVRIPGFIEFESAKKRHRFRLHDLSAGGFSFEAPGSSFRVGDQFRGNLTVSVDGIAMALTVGFQVRNFDAASGRTGVSFLELGQREVSALRHLITSYLSGELFSVGDMLSTAARDNFTPARARRAKLENGGLNGRLKAMLMSVLFLAAGVTAFVYVASSLNRLLFVTSAQAAKIAAPTFTIAMPREGSFHSLVPKDGKVRKGAPIATFEAPVFDLVKSQIASTNLSPEQLERMLGVTVKGTITSPCDCRVRTQYVADTQYVAHGQPLFDLVPQEYKPYVLARFRYDQMDSVPVGAAVHFRVNGESHSRLGKISDVRDAGQTGESVTTDLMVTIEPVEPVPADLIGRPVEVAAGSLNKLPETLAAITGGNSAEAAGEDR